MPIGGGLRNGNAGILLAQDQPPLAQLEAASGNLNGKTAACDGGPRHSTAIGNKAHEHDSRKADTVAVTAPRYGNGIPSSGRTKNVKKRKSDAIAKGSNALSVPQHECDDLSSAAGNEGDGQHLNSNEGTNENGNVNRAGNRQQQQQESCSASESGQGGSNSHDDEDCEETEGEGDEEQDARGLRSGGKHCQIAAAGTAESDRRADASFAAQGKRLKRSPDTVKGGIEGGRESSQKRGKGLRGQWTAEVRMVPHNRHPPAFPVGSIHPPSAHLLESNGAFTLHPPTPY